MIRILDKQLLEETRIGKVFLKFALYNFFYGLRGFLQLGLSLYPFPFRQDRQERLHAKRKPGSYTICIQVFTSDKTLESDEAEDDSVPMVRSTATLDPV